MRKVCCEEARRQRVSEKSTPRIKNVLLVDDDANIRFIIETSLEGLTNWRVTSVESGQEAVDYLSQARPDLVLLDIMMPDMDGIMIFEKIKERNSFNVEFRCNNDRKEFVFMP